MTNGTNENWLRGNGEQLDNSPLALNKPPIDEVDQLADELANEYDNEAYRTWYCKLIYEHGIERVRYWQQKARSGDFPGKLFGYYVRQAKLGKAPEPSKPKRFNPDDGYIQNSAPITMADLTEAGIVKALDDGIKQYGLDEPSTPKAIPWMDEDD